MTTGQTSRPVKLVSPTSMGRTNRSRVLQLLLRNGPASRAHLARTLGVNRATIATILQPMIDDGTLVEGEAVSASPSGGKPARPLWFNERGAELGSLRISSTRLTAARLGMDGSIRQQSARDIEPGWALDHIVDTLLDLTSECFEGRDLVGVGIAAAGMVDTSTGTILSLHLAPVLNGFAIADLLGSEHGVPVAVDHHPRVLALGDKWFGLGRTLDDFASVYTGEALGMGIVHDGDVFRGYNGAGGEYGHTVVDVRGDLCMCGRRGCWETIATTRWLRAQATAAGLPGASSMDCAELVALAARGHPMAAELADRYAANIAIGLANNEHMLASSTYIMHGDVVGGGAYMRRRLQHHLTASAPHRGEQPTVLLDLSDDDTVLLGGGGLVLSSVYATTV
ncbi:ROK family transcriptional regulator [Ruania alkalisoli]|uniref:ROK family transcriptional regulator n=1 Tax=Ruania alkalisoli TaxID=2779775 RepID=A0A7M1SRX2_9MICO|nr:ROK family transcriptional regulator [Ruania alkalisoli]QOR70319.1 ROK family transcriptional regulator [Ruania alkalisoli]